MHDSSKPGHAVPPEKTEPDSPIFSEDSEVVAGESIEPMGAGTPELPIVSAAPKESATGRHAFMVGAGILISRIVGLVRQRVFAYYFGTSAAGDAFSAAFRIPNFLQNIFGEG